jgi:protein SCO1
MTMNAPAQKRTLAIFGGLALAGAAASLVFLAAAIQKAESSQPLPVIRPVADFALTNQNGQLVSRADLRGHVWVADVIFTRCAGPCLKMSRQMKELQQALPAASGARLVTLTTDPDFDTPPVLKTYSERLASNPDRWLFLTGKRSQIASLITGSLKLTAMEKESGEQESQSDLFIHSTIFVIVDKQGQLRGTFEITGEGVEAGAVQARILAAVRQLERES